jgi:hypothetical protein
VLADSHRFCLDGSLVGHVKQQRNKRFAKFPLQTIRICAAPHTSKHTESAAEQDLDASVPNSSGNAGDDDLFHKERLVTGG